MFAAATILGGAACTTSDSNDDTSTSAASEGGASESGATAAEASGSGSSSSSSDGGGEGDGGPSQTCDLGKQDCGDGEKCTAYVAEEGACCVDSTKCVPVTGDARLGEGCERMEDNDTCAAGFFCLAGQSGDVGPGRCLQLCDPDADDPCAPLPAACITVLDGLGSACFLTCSPTDPDGCPTGLGCYQLAGAAESQGDFVCLPPAVAEGGGNDGDECEVPQSCNPGLQCTEGSLQDGCSAEGFCCTPVCDTTNNGSECTGGEVCVPYYGEGQAPPGSETAGFCGIPQ